MLPPATLATFQRVALLGLTFSTDELLAVADGTEDETYGQLELALGALVVEPAEGGFRFRHPLVRDGLVEQLPPHSGSEGTNGSPRRWPGWTDHRAGSPTTTWPPGLASRAVPYVVRAVEIAGALGAYRDALDPGRRRPRARRARRTCPSCCRAAATC